MTNRNTVPAAQITDAMIEKVILDYLARPLTGQVGNHALRQIVADHFTNYSLQLRRVVRIAGEMADRGVITLNAGHPNGYGLRKAMWSEV